MRRDHGPKRRAESYAFRTHPNADAPLLKSVRQMLIGAYMAGLRSASRARRRTNGSDT